MGKDQTRDLGLPISEGLWDLKFLMETGHKSKSLPDRQNMASQPSLLCLGT